MVWHYYDKLRKCLYSGMWIMNCFFYIIHHYFKETLWKWRMHESFQCQNSLCRFSRIALSWSNIFVIMAFKIYIWVFVSTLFLKILKSQLINIERLYSGISRQHISYYVHNLPTQNQQKLQIRIWVILGQREINKKTNKMT